MRKSLIQFMAFLLVALPLLGVFADQASAASSRVAVIKELKGTVKVKKSGGSKEFTAFAKMSLNEGDILNVGVGGSAVLQFSNGTSEDDKMTVSANTTMTFSKLSNSNGTVTKVSILSGSVWSTVKSISNPNDEFTLETPTAIMGVRGTNLLVGVDPETGESMFFIVSGVGNVSKKSNNDQTTLYPSQQISLDDRNENTNQLDNGVNIVNLEDLAQNISATIIEAIISSKNAIDKENDEYITKIKNQLNTDPNTPADSLDIKNLEELNRVSQNLNNLVANIVKTAIKQNKVDKEHIVNFVDEINKQLYKRIDLDNIVPLELSDKEKAKQEELKKLEAARMAKLAAEKKLEEEVKKQNEALINKLKAQSEAAAATKKQAEEEMKAKALVEYEKQLDEATKKQFEAAKKALKEEQQNESPSTSPSVSPGPVLSDDAKLTNIQMQSVVSSPSPSPSESPSESSSASPSASSSASPSASPSPTQISFTPLFDGNTLSYTAQVENDVSSIQVKGIVNESHAVIKINDNVLASGVYSEVINLDVGTNTIKLLVTAQNNTTQNTYTLTVERLKPRIYLNDIKIFGFDVPDEITYRPEKLNYEFTVDEFPQYPSIYFYEYDIPEGSSITVTINGNVINAKSNESNSVYYYLYVDEVGYVQEGLNTLSIDVSGTGYETTTYTFNVNVDLPDVPVGLDNWAASVGEEATNVPIHRVQRTTDQYYIELPSETNAFNLLMNLGTNVESATLYYEIEASTDFDDIDGYEHTISLSEGYNTFWIDFIGSEYYEVELIVLVGDVSEESTALNEVIGNNGLYINDAESNEYTGSVDSSVISAGVTVRAEHSLSTVRIYQVDSQIAHYEGHGYAFADLSGFHDGWNEFTIRVTDFTGNYTEDYKLSIMRADTPNPFAVVDWNGTDNYGPAEFYVDEMKPDQYYVHVNWDASELTINPTFIDSGVTIKSLYYYVYDEATDKNILTEFSGNSVIPISESNIIFVELMTPDNHHYTYLLNIQFIVQ